MILSEQIPVIASSEQSVIVISEAKLEADHQKFEKTIVLVHHLSILAGVLGILFTILEYAVILCIIFDSISVLSAILAVFMDRRHNRECDEIKNSF